MIPEFLHGVAKLVPTIEGQFSITASDDLETRTDPPQAEGLGRQTGKDARRRYPRGLRYLAADRAALLPAPDQDEFSAPLALKTSSVG